MFIFLLSDVSNLIYVPLPFFFWSLKGLCHICSIYSVYLLLILISIFRSIHILYMGWFCIFVFLIALMWQQQLFMLVLEFYLYTLHLRLTTFTLTSYISSTCWFSFCFSSCHILSCLALYMSIWDCTFKPF